MTTTRKAQPTDWREGRRMRAWELHHQGWTQTRIAAALGVTQGAVSQWLTRAHIGVAWTPSAAGRLQAGVRP